MLLSIIIPFYKGNLYINNLLACILRNQENLSEKNIFDIIIINDSPDETVQINNKFEQVLPIHVYNNERNYGIHGSRVEGIKKTHSEYILMIDQDDYIVDDALKMIIPLLRGDTSADMLVFNGYKKYVDTCNKMDELLIPHIFPKSFMRNIYWYCSVENPIASPGQVVLKRERIPYEWCENIMTSNGSDDMFLWMLMIRMNRKIRYYDIPIYFHVETGKNFGRNSSKMNESDLSVRDIMVQYHLLTKLQIKLINRNVSFKYLRLRKNLLSNFYIIFFYPDILLGRVLAKFIRKIDYMIN